MRYSLQTFFSSSCLLIVICVATASPAPGQDGRLDIHSLSRLADNASEYVEVDLEGPALRSALELLHLDKQTAQVDMPSLLSTLGAIHIRSFRFDQAAISTQAALELFRGQLREKGWARINRHGRLWECHDPEVYARRVTHQMRGLAIICSEPRALTVVHILGTMDLDKLDDLASLIKRLKVRQ